MSDVTKETLPSKLIEYESGGLNDEESVKLFQYLIDSDLAWQLQGHYGRMADYLVKEGLCEPKRA